MLFRNPAFGGLAIFLLSVILGNVIRVRAQYVPKVAQLDQEDGKDSDVMGVSYMLMLKKVIKLEGWKGLFRGIVPLTIITVIAQLRCPMPHGCALVLYYWHPILDALARCCLLVVFDLPFTVFVVRSITTPEILSFFGVRRAVRALLSPRERQSPWLLYFSPGLLLVIALGRAWALLIPLFTKLVNRHVPELLFFPGITLQTIARLSLVLWHTAILVPLEVIKVRLAMQRYEQPVALPEGPHDGSGAGEITDNVEPSETVTPRVVRLRIDSGQPAYTSLFNCVRSIMAEEGFEAFYRASWFTFLAVLFFPGTSIILG